MLGLGDRTLSLVIFVVCAERAETCSASDCSGNNICTTSHGCQDWRSVECKIERDMAQGPRPDSSACTTGNYYLDGGTEFEGQCKSGFCTKKSVAECSGKAHGTACRCVSQACDDDTGKCQVTGLSEPKCRSSRLFQCIGEAPGAACDYNPPASWNALTSQCGTHSLTAGDFTCQPPPVGACAGKAEGAACDFVDLDKVCKPKLEDIGCNNPDYFRVSSVGGKCAGASAQDRKCEGATETQREAMVSRAGRVAGISSNLMAGVGAIFLGAVMASSHF